jgi:hypothetical protein
VWAHHNWLKFHTSLARLLSDVIQFLSGEFTDNKR